MVLSKVAQERLSAGRIDEAYSSIQSAYVVEPNNPLVHKIFGQVFAWRRQPDLAFQAYNRSLGLNPNDAETHKLVGDLYLFLRQVSGSGYSSLYAISAFKSQ